jgi:MFS family permease
MLAAYGQALRGAHRNIPLLLTSSALMGFAIDGGITSVILNLYLLRLDFGPEFVGQVNAVANVAFAVCSLLAGWLGMRWGARRIMLSGLSLSLFGYMCVPLADSVPTAWRAPWIFASMLIAFPGLALYFVNVAPYLLRATRVEARGHVFGLQSAIVAVAGFAGGLIGGFLPALVAGIFGVPLTQPGPYRVPLVLVAVTLMVALVVVLQTRDVEEDQPIEFRTAPRGAPMVVSAFGLIAFVAGLRFLQVAAVAAGTTFFNVYMDNALMVATAQIGMISATARLASVPAALIVPSLCRRFGFGATAVYASVISSLSLLPLALVPQPLIAGVGFVSLMAVTSIRYPAFYVFMMERTPDRLRSLMNGVSEMAAGFSFAFVSMAGGYAIVTYGYAATFLGAGLLTLLSAVVLWVYLRARGETPAQIRSASTTA